MRVTPACLRVIEVPPGRRPADLLTDLRLIPGDVFTAAEAQLCSQRADLTGWAGRLAAKLAVAELISPRGRYRPDMLLAIEILPDPSLCPDPGCTRSHPPVVRLAPPLTSDDPIHVSISHTAALAVAVAFVSCPEGVSR